MTLSLCFPIFEETVSQNAATLPIHGEFIAIALCSKRICCLRACYWEPLQNSTLFIKVLILALPLIGNRVASHNFAPEELFDTLLGGPNTDADNSVYKASMVSPSISNVSANGTTLSLSIRKRKRKRKLGVI